MNHLTHLPIEATRVSNNKITMDKHAFDNLIACIYKLTDTVNEIIDINIDLKKDNAKIHEDIKALASALTILGGN